MAWPELLKAKRNIECISREIDNMLKSNNSLTRKEMKSALIGLNDVSLDVIEDQMEELRGHIENHRKYVRSKSYFVARHYSRTLRPGTARGAIR